MQFRTEINIMQAARRIEHEEPILTIGSCFAENMGEKLKKHRFSILLNPFGVLYNPASIYNSLQLLGQDTFSRDELSFHAGEWHSFYHHSDFSHHEKWVCLDKINSRLETAKSFLEKARFIIITLGTSYVFQNRENGSIVSNCHKIPAEQFKRIFLTQEDSEKYLEKTAAFIRETAPDIHMILTVSPIRHIKDGLALNQKSKAALLLAVHNFTASNENCSYFPSYEIMLDDLRDYRFYESNLTHPNDTAKEYIWQKFAEYYFSDDCRKTLKDLEPLIKARSHRPRNEQGPAYQDFVKKQLKSIEKLTIQYPHISFDDDEDYFTAKLL